MLLVNIKQKAYLVNHFHKLIGNYGYESSNEKDPFQHDPELPTGKLGECEIEGVGLKFLHLTC